MSKIVITGIGIVSPIATGREAFWEGLLQGKTGFRSITLFDAAPFQCRVAGEITDFDPVALLGRKGLRDLDRSTRLICSAAKLAIEDSRFEITETNTCATGVSIGTTFGSLHSISQFDRSGLMEGPRSVNPSHFPNTVINSPSSQVSIRFNIKGFNTTISTGFCAGLDAVSYAADFLHLKRASVVLAGGVEELCEETFRGFHDLGLLSGLDGSEPFCCPFDAGRNGTILSEGAAVLVLEDEEHAESRGAVVLGRVLGCGNAFDPQSDISFKKAGQGLSAAIEKALDRASLKPGDIDYICAGANSTTGLDGMEASVIRKIFGDSPPPVSSVKSMIGESYSASGAIALAAAAGALWKSFIPPNGNYREKDDVRGLDCVSHTVLSRELRHALVIASDPFGQNSAVILGR